MKRIAFLLLLSIAVRPEVSAAAVASPTELNVAAGVDTITVSWRANTDDTDGYYVYWGSSRTGLDSRRSVPEISSTSLTIGNLNPGAMYFVAVSAYGSDVFGNTMESQKSEIASATTDSDEDDDDDPLIPEGFSVSPDSVTKSDVTFIWDPIDDENVAAYRIYYGVSTGLYPFTTGDIQRDASSFTVSELNRESRYYFVIRSVDQNGRESANSMEWIVDTVYDRFSPDAPAALQVEIIGHGQVRLKFNGNNAGMADLAGYRIHHGRTEGMTESPIDIGLDTSYEMGDLIEDETYFFSVSAYDRNGNGSDLSAVVSIVMERFRSLLIDNDDFQAGCFVASSALSFHHAGWPFFLVLLTALLIGRSVRPWTKGLVFLGVFCFAPPCPPLGGAAEHSPNNALGLKVGVYFPAEELHREIYGDDAVSLSLFYDRRIVSDLHIDIEMGFIDQKGRLRTPSGTRTNVSSRFLLVPVSSTLKWHVHFTDFLFAYIGGGPDLWYFREKTGDVAYDAFDEDEYGVGGYHGKIGLAYLSDEEECFKRCGVLIEGIFNKIDRFDRNGVNIGGWTIQGGYLYRF